MSEGNMIVETKVRYCCCQCKTGALSYDNQSHTCRCSGLIRQPLQHVDRPCDSGMKRCWDVPKASIPSYLSIDHVRTCFRHIVSLRYAAQRSPQSNIAARPPTTRTSCASSSLLLGSGRLSRCTAYLYPL